jgi:sugar transferase (PEP-CTERM/EpsH1 system associated)
VVYRFDVGGLENGVVNLINHMPADAYRHAVVALTDVTDFRRRVQRDDVEFVALHKPPGHALALYPRLYRLFRRMRPAIVHTRNLAALEVVVPAWAAGVPARVHGEHGRDVEDLAGQSRRHQWIRRVYRPFVTRYIALSRDLQRYLTGTVGVPDARVAQIYNGVDSDRFHPRRGARPALAGCPFSAPGLWLVGAVGRMQAVKDPTTLARAFIEALQRAPALRERLRLVFVGDGPLRAPTQALLDAAGAGELCWMAGERSDVPELMRGLDVFVQPSLAEGISNTILEAMATGLAVVATDVGGNAELVEHGVSGVIVPPADPAAIADALVRLASDPAQAAAMGLQARAAVERRFSLQAMVGQYRAQYDRLAAASGGRKG